MNYPGNKLEEIRTEALKTPADPDLIFRLQKRLKEKKIVNSSNPFKDMTAEEASKLLGTDID